VVLVFLWPLLASLFNELYSLKLRQCVHYIGSLTKRRARTKVRTTAL
jgi:hypothetical protein